ncbi:MAG TPA: MFS transporter [candidate division Zixibacteria bacterium]|nr:MFS transporter [candidate division Zixibacteria bacterium]
MNTERSILRRDVIAWSLYDFANTIFSMNIISLYLKRHIVEDLGFGDRHFDIPYSISMLAAALVLPALGAISDQAGKKKAFLFLFTLTCCIATGLLAFVPVGAIAVTIVLLITANFSYEAGQPFYNALLYSVAEGRQARFVSGVGVAMGYVGSVGGMLLVLPFVTGSLFSWDVPLLEAGGKTAAFIPTAVLFFLFALPTFLWVKEKRSRTVSTPGLIRAYKEVWESLRDTRRYPGVLRFLIADYFIEDAVAVVIINMGLYASVVIGFHEELITMFLVVSTVSAVIGSFIIGKVATIVSLKKLMVVIVAGWLAGLVLFVFTASQSMIWILGSLIGILLGGLWTVSRPLLAELVPENELGRFFGLFSLSGRAAAVLGPLIWTASVYLFNANRFLGGQVVEIFKIGPEQYDQLPYRAAVLSLVVMMAIGLFIFRKVPETGDMDYAKKG